MATPHYVARKVGDRYVMVRKDCEPRVDVACVLLGSFLLWRGLRRRGLIGGMAALAGVLALGRGFTGHMPLCGREGLTRGRVPRSASGPSFQHDVRPHEQRPKDEVDEAVMESFPASDPPARMSRTTHI